MNTKRWRSSGRQNDLPDPLALWPVENLKPDDEFTSKKQTIDILGITGVAHREAYSPTS